MAEPPQIPGKSRANKGRPLSVKHQTFVDHYMIQRNATKAAIAAGYAPSGAQSVGSDLINLPGPCRMEIERRLDKISARYNVTAERIVAEYAKIAFATLDDVIDIAQDGTPVINFNKSTPESRAAISELTQETYTECPDSSEAPRKARTEGDDSGEVDDAALRVKRTKIKLHDKLGALRDLARWQKLFDDRMDTAEDAEEKGKRIRDFLAQAKEADGA